MPEVAKGEEVMSQDILSGFYKAQFQRSLFLAALIISMSGCAGMLSKPASKPTPEKTLASERAKQRKTKASYKKLQKAYRKQVAAKKKLGSKVKELQARLKAKENLITECKDGRALMQKKLNAAFQEVVRAKAKLRSLEGKAEAASNIAEAEVALTALKTKWSGQKRGPEVIQAEHLLEMSSKELNNDNFGGALYLAGKAKNLIKMGQARLNSGGKASTVSEEVLFVLPVPLKVLRKSNVREGPGKDFKVVFTLKKGAKVKGHSSKDKWVWVKSEDDRSGWIFHTLIKGL